MPNATVYCGAELGGSEKRVSDRNWLGLTVILELLFAAISSQRWGVMLLMGICLKFSSCTHAIALE